MINGVIEGFYGQPWPQSDRLTYPQFLQNIACNTYVYAPKSDIYLRSQWHQAWPELDRIHLQELAACCTQNGIKFGVGLSPLGISSDFNTANQARLAIKLQAIASLGVSLLCLLFDDIPGDSNTLAAEQLRVCEFVEQQWQGDLIMCPTYYSNDEALEQHFGNKPDNYWPSLAQGLSTRWQLLWTGEQVVSLEYTVKDLNNATQALGRKPLIWDNYPVNDGRLLWPFMNLAPLNRVVLNTYASGVLHNPMNQAWCSKVTLARMKGKEANLAKLLDAPEALIEQLLADAEQFQSIGLEHFSPEQLKAFKAIYSVYEHTIAQEVLAWLSGHYEFDPACLT